MRVLAGLIFECGLLPPNLSEQELHKQARHNFSEYRYKFNPNKFNLYFLFIWVFRILCRKRANYTNNSELKIEFIGVWDTVDAYGLPIDELKTLWSKFIFPLSLANRELNCDVRKLVTQFRSMMSDTRFIQFCGVKANTMLALSRYGFRVYTATLAAGIQITNSP